MKQVIYQLELSLLDPLVRQSADRLDRLIADDFVEFGSSGRIYYKRDCLEPDEKPRTFIVKDFEIKELSKDVILATYKSVENSLASLRSSIWKRYGHDWKMVFHQGTKCERE